VLTRSFNSEPLVGITFASLRMLRSARPCLEKDPEDRYQSMRDVVPDLRSVGVVTESGRADRKSAPLAWIAVAAVLALVAAGLGFGLYRATRPVDRPLIRLDVDLDTDVSLPAPFALTGNPLTISPDGTRLAYASGTQVKLFIRRLDQAKATELPGTQGAAGPFFSPDGQWVGFRLVPTCINKRILR
jgi:serine/threonine-protein kinase